MEISTKLFIQLAHCDIPCGIYDPTPAKIAAKTVLKMVQQLKELKHPETPKNRELFLQYKNDIERRVAIKEEHAQICKKELYILWSDFFKPEHLQKYPNLHELFWQAIKLCSKNKQGVNEELAQKLVAEVDKIAKIFYETKNMPDNYDDYKSLIS